MAHALSLSLGVVLGGFVVLVWRALGRRLGDAEFWPSLRQIARGMVTGQSQEDFFGEYARLLRLLGRYLAKTGCRVGLTVLPVVILVVLAGPVANRYEAGRADRLRVYPPQPTTIDISGQRLEFDSTGTSGRHVGVPFGPAMLVTDSSSLPLADFEGALAVSNCAWTCAGLQLMGLDAQTIDEGPALLIVRPAGEATNLLWPYLGNLEFSFWAGMIVSSLLVGGFIKLRAK